MIGAPVGACVGKPYGVVGSTGLVLARSFWCTIGATATALNPTAQLEFKEVTVRSVWFTIRDATVGATVGVELLAGPPVELSKSALLWGLVLDTPEAGSVGSMSEVGAPVGI